MKPGTARYGHLHQLDEQRRQRLGPFAAPRGRKRRQKAQKAKLTFPKPVPVPTVEDPAMSLTARLEELAARQEAEAKAAAHATYSAAVRKLADADRLPDADLLAASGAARLIGRPIDQIEQDAAALRDLPGLRRRVAALPTAEQKQAARLALVAKVGALQGELYCAQHGVPGRVWCDVQADIDALNGQIATLGSEEVDLCRRLKQAEGRRCAVGLLDA